MDCYRLRNSSDVFSDLLVARIVTVVSSASTPCCVVTTPVAMLHIAVPPQRLRATYVYGAYVGPMLIHVRLLDAMLGQRPNDVELMLSQKRRVPFEPLPGPKGTRRFWLMSDHAGRIWSLCWAYGNPCGALGRYVGAIFEPC